MVVVNVTDDPFMVITPPGYTPTIPYTKVCAPVVAVVGDGELEAVTPCVDVDAFISLIVCVNVVPVNVTAVSFISIHHLLSL